MKSFAIVFLMFLSAGCHSAASNSSSKPRLNANSDARILAPATIEIKSIVAVIDELKAGGAEAIGFGIKST
jgi:hypothetical protein